MEKLTLVKKKGKSSMSIKIYNGYIIRKNLTLMELNELMNTLRKKWQKKVLRMYKKLYFEKFYLYSDLYVVNPDTCKKILEANNINLFLQKETFSETLADNLLWSLFDKIAKVTASGKYSPYNLSAQLQLLPLQDKLMILSFGNSEIDDLIQDVSASMGIEEYHYQNQTDKPEKISEEEWKRRYQDWKTAMPTWIPGEFGFSVKLFSENWLPISVKEIIKTSSYEEYKKPLEKRCQRLVEYLIPYPEFTGSNYSVFTTEEFSSWKNKEAKQFEKQLKEAGDAVECIFKMYSSEEKNEG